MFACLSKLIWGTPIPLWITDHFWPIKNAYSTRGCYWKWIHSKKLTAIVNCRELSQKNAFSRWVGQENKVSMYSIEERAIAPGPWVLACGRRASSNQMDWFPEQINSTDLRHEREVFSCRTYYLVKGRLTLSWRRSLSYRNQSIRRFTISFPFRKLHSFY